MAVQSLKRLKAIAAAAKPKGGMTPDGPRGYEEKEDVDFDDLNDSMNEAADHMRELDNALFNTNAAKWYKKAGGKVKTDADKLEKLLREAKGIMGRIESAAAKAQK